MSNDVFRAKCRCFPGFKSTNPAGGKFLNADDSCIVCAYGESCGNRPTASPTQRPTVSFRPTIKPTSSNSPTSHPSLTQSPSSVPTTRMPSHRPTLSKKPSKSPSLEPSSYQSILDGEYCIRNNECSIMSCINNKCMGLVSKYGYTSHVHVRNSNI